MNTPLGAAPEDLAEVERIVRAAGTSFYRGMRVLPPDRRAAMYAIYAFCRIVDDIADEASPLHDRLPRLAEWRARVAGFCAGQADDAVSRVLACAVPAFALREADFLAVIEGMEWDAREEILAPGLDELERYCDLVAVAVGRLSVRAFGDASPAADAVALNLGRALQLTNILRDIGEDAERGRLYLPREYLAEAGVPAELPQALASPGLAQVCDRLATRAQTYFDAATTAMTHCNRRAMKPARLMSASYAAILATLRHRGWHDVTTRVSVPTWRKLALVVRLAVG